MASENELALLITARDQASATLKGLNSQIKAIGGAADNDASPGINRLGANTTREFSRMTMEGTRFGENLMSGNVIGAVVDFARMAGTAFHALSIEIALATGGLALIAGAIAIAWKKSSEDSKQAVKDTKERATAEKEYQRVMAKTFEDKKKLAEMEAHERANEDIAVINRRYALEAEAVRRGLEKQDAALMSFNVGRKQHAENLEVALEELETKRINDVMDRVDKEIYETDKANKEIDKKDTTELRTKLEKELKNKEDLWNIQKQYNDTNFNAKKAAIANLTFEEQDAVEKEKINLATGEISYSQYLDRMILLSKTYAAKKRKLEIEDEANLAKRITLDRGYVATIDQVYTEEEVAIARLGETIGSSIQSSFGSLVVGFVNTSKSFGEELVNFFNQVGNAILDMLAQIAAKLAISGIADFIFNAAGGIGFFADLVLPLLGFATAPGQSKQVPGPYGAPQLAIVHGKEIISNPYGNSGGGGVTYNFLGPVLNPESLRRVLWDHSRRTGMPVQAFA